MNKSGTILLFVASFTLILVAIVFTAVINRSGESGDLRARASKNAGIAMRGTVRDVDETSRTLTVDSIAFESSPDKLLGDGWKVTVKQEGSLERFSTGTEIRLIAESSKLSISDKIIIALEVDRR